MYQNIYVEPFKGKVHIWDDRNGYVSTHYKKYAYVRDNYGTFASLYGDKLKKIYRWDKTAEGLWESDVNPEMRTLIDMYGQSEEPSTGHKIFIFDMEVEVTEGFPDPMIGPNKITSIAMWDNISNVYTCLVLDENKTLDITGFGKNVVVESYQTEYELLQRFYQKYLELRPTIITGWNVDGFDIPYLYNRTIKVLGQSVADNLSPISKVIYSKYANRYKIAGVSVLDYLLLYKDFTFGSRPSYRLDDIGQFEVGSPKISYDGTLNDLYENDLRKFVEYNIHDVRIVKQLDDKLDFIDIARGICHIGHVPYEDIYFSSRYLEGAILTHLNKLNIVAPNKPEKGEFTDKKFVGAYVKSPQRGKHDWVIDLDITSEYPSIIMSLNISPETKLGKVIGWNAQDFIAKKKKTHSIILGGKKKGQLTNTELDDFFNDNKVSISSAGILYKTDKQGLIPTILSKWFDTRKEFRKLAKKFSAEGNDERYEYFDRRQYIQKILLNSLYGTLGLQGWRFYDLENAASTTETGQDLIKFTAKITNHFYNTEVGTPVEVELENGEVRKLHENNRVDILRNGRKLEIKVKDLQETDDFLS
ncbi:hypothetical protein H8D04_00900 [bacterium]|nr:hypothetical protein [bacterium]